MPGPTFGKAIGIILTDSKRPNFHLLIFTIMKQRFSLAFMEAFLIFFAVVFWPGCTRDDSDTQPSSLQATDDSPQIPGEIAAYLSGEEIAAFLASRPTYTPSSAQDRGEQGKRPKKWRPFYAWGDVVGHFYPLLTNCNDPLTAVICFAPGDCPDQSAWVGYFGGFIDNEGHMTGYGKVDQSWQRFVCGPLGTPGGQLNGSYEKDEHLLQFRPAGPPALTFNDDGAVNLDFPMSVCNATYPNPACWQYSAGDFHDSEGTFTWRLTTDFSNFFAPMFADQLGHVTAWGWLYY